MAPEDEEYTPIEDVDPEEVEPGKLRVLNYEALCRVFEKVECLEDGQEAIMDRLQKHGRLLRVKTSEGEEVYVDLQQHKEILDIMREFRDFFFDTIPLEGEKWLGVFWRRFRQVTAMVATILLLWFALQLIPITLPPELVEFVRALF